MKKQLYKLLYEWLVDEDCGYCQHYQTFRDGDKRHACNKCEAYESFKLSDMVRKELDDKVKQIIGITKNH